MRLQVLGSSSEGNCYLLTAETGETLIIEAGVPYRDMARALGSGMAKVRGCIVSHEHKDHSGHLHEVIANGITAYANPETRHAVELQPKIQVSPCFWRELKSDQMTTAGEFEILPFEVRHDVPCLGFLIRHREMGTLSFITDTHYSPRRFSGVDHFMVEANYDEETAIENIRQAENAEDMAKAIALRGRLRRVKATHMEINTTIELLKANMADNRMAKVVLIHTSKENGDPETFKRKTETAIGRQVFCARPGLIVELNRKN